MQESNRQGQKASAEFNSKKNRYSPAARAGGWRSVRDDAQEWGKISPRHEEGGGGASASLHAGIRHPAFRSAAPHLNRNTQQSTVSVGADVKSHGAPHKWRGRNTGEQEGEQSQMRGKEGIRPLLALHIKVRRRYVRGLHELEDCREPTHDNHRHQICSGSLLSQRTVKEVWPSSRSPKVNP